MIRYGQPVQRLAGVVLRDHIIGAVELLCEVAATAVAVAAQPK